MAADVERARGPFRVPAAAQRQRHHLHDRGPPLAALVQQRELVGADLDPEVRQQILPLSAKENDRSRSRSSQRSPDIRSRCRRSGGSLRLASTSWAVSAGQRSTRSVMARPTGRGRMEVVHDDGRPGGQPGGIVRDRGRDVGRHCAIHREQVGGVGPDPGASARGASTKPIQNRAGLASALSQDSQDVASGARLAAQLDSSTLLPAPADPTTTVSLLSAPAVSRSCSAGLVTRVVGSVVGRNLVCANLAPEASRFVAVTIVPAHDGSSRESFVRKFIASGICPARMARIDSAWGMSRVTSRRGDDAVSASWACWQDAWNHGGLRGSSEAHASTHVRDHLYRPGGRSRDPGRVRRL